MATRGRKPTPAVVKAAKGNPGKRRAVQEPAAEAVPSVIGATPRTLGKEAKDVWKDMAPKLAAMRFVRETDREAFARYCEYVAEF